MIYLKNIYFDYAGFSIFEDANLSIYRTDKIGVIGKNGSGKTTLLNLIAGNLEITKGQIIKEGNVKIGIIPQEIYFNKNETPFSLAKNAFEKEITLLKQFDQLSKMLEKNSNSNKLHQKYDLLLSEIDKLDAFNFDFKIRRILYAMGFTQEDFKKPLKLSSGGFKVRAYIAYLLLLKPDLLLLDEPTNYLDIDSRIFLIKFLKNYNKAFIIISHDKYFLNEVVKKIVHVANKKLFLYYSSNYDEFERKKDLLLRQAYEFEKNKNKKISQLENFINKFKAKKNFSSRVRNKIKQVERLKNQTLEIPEEKEINFHLKSSNKHFSNIISFSNVSFAYINDNNNNKKYNNFLFKNISFSIVRGQKIILMGKNGIGKTTLLKLAKGILKPISGEITIHNKAAIGYFAQNIIEQLDFNKTVLEEFSETERTQNMTEGEKRTILGIFGFSNEDVFKKIKVLSGGEKVRLILSKIFINQPDILILDEPTTHIDIKTKEVLKESLKYFDGAIFTVSHDIDFIKSIGKEFWTIENKNLVFLNSFNDYIKLYNQKEINKYTNKKNWLQNQKTISKNFSQQNNLKKNTKKKYDKKKFEDNLKGYEINKTGLHLSKNEIYRKTKLLEQLESEINEIENNLNNITKKLAEEKNFNELKQLKIEYEKFQNILKEKEKLYFETYEILESN